jgi:hypothetical protein
MATARDTARDIAWDIAGDIACVSSAMTALSIIRIGYI